jgi:hypothetical protein
MIMTICNPLSPGLMSPEERRAEVCAILARGLVRLRMRQAQRQAGDNGDFPLHFSAGQSATAEPLERRTA